MLELIHTWSDQMPGGAGFMTVYRTTGMSTRTTRALELRSGMELSSAAPGLPIRGHRTMMLDGVNCSVLSSITQTAGPSPDHPCRIAHHLVLTPGERPSISPVGLLMSGWFRTDWDGTSPSGADSPPLPDHAEFSVCHSLDPEWLRILNHRVAAHAGTSIMVPPSTRCIDVVAAIEQTLSPEAQWAFTFLTNTDRMRDAAILLAVHEGSPPARRIAAANEGVVLLLKNPPTPISHATAIENSDTDQAEPTPTTLQLDPARVSGCVIAMAVIAAAALMAVIVAIAGWFP
jgi:hypothetical protein